MPTTWGPWLVALGAALWGPERAWRIPLNDLFAAPVIVFLEHVILVALFLPVLWFRRREFATIKPAAWGYLIFSGIAGSAVGTIFFTEALKHGNATVVNVVLNLQPILSTTAACLLFGDKLSSKFFLWAPVALLAGIALSVENPSQIFVSFKAAGLTVGTGYALICALFWSLSTVAGRGAMTGMSLPVGAALRVAVGLLTMTLILAATGQLSSLWPAAAQAKAGTASLQMFLLATLSGGIPLLFYFQGLKLTRASTAGYFEMMQTLAAVCITWGFFGQKLAAHQVVAGIILIVAVALVQRAQAGVEAASFPSVAA